MPDKETKDFQFPTAARPEVDNPETEAVEHEPSEDAIDQGVVESFPASDPVSVSVTKIERKDDDSTKDD